jgi:hypothetical protein
MLPWLPGPPILAFPALRATGFGGASFGAMLELARGDPALTRALRLGLWAGKRLGYGGAALALYGLGAMLAGEPRARRRIAVALAEAGRGATEAEMEQAMEGAG